MWNRTTLQGWVSAPISLVPDGWDPPSEREAPKTRRQKLRNPTPTRSVSRGGGWPTAQGLACRTRNGWAKDQGLEGTARAGQNHSRKQQQAHRTLVVVGGHRKRRGARSRNSASQRAFRLAGEWRPASKRPCCRLIRVTLSVSGLRPHDIETGALPSTAGSAPMPLAGILDDDEGRPAIWVASKTICSRICHSRSNGRGLTPATHGGDFSRNADDQRSRCSHCGSRLFPGRDSQVSTTRLETCCCAPGPYRKRPSQSRLDHIAVGRRGVLLVLGGKRPRPADLACSTPECLGICSALRLQQIWPGRAILVDLIPRPPDNWSISTAMAGGSPRPRPSPLLDQDSPNRFRRHWRPLHGDRD